MQEVYDFLKEAGTYYLATDEGGQPRVRPFGTIHIFDGKLYFQTGASKAVSKQMHANGNVEICAMKEGEWIRLSGKVEADSRREAKESLLDAYPSLKAMYSADDENTEVWGFVPGTAQATISSFTDEPKTYTF